MSVGSGLSGLLAGGFDWLGYIPVEEAVQMCEGQARWRVEEEIDRKVLEEGIMEIRKQVELAVPNLKEFSLGWVWHLLVWFGLVW